MTPARTLVRATFALLLVAACHRSEHSTGRPAAGDGGRLPGLVVAKVTSGILSLTVALPGELEPYEAVAIYPKVAGFVRRIDVDRGSIVEHGEVIAELDAPELAARRAEGQANLGSAQSRLASSQAKLASDRGTYERVRAAAQTPGVVAGNDLDVSEQTVRAAEAAVKTAEDGVTAARQALRALADLEAYLHIRAPFDGIVTERNVHPGALVGPATNPNQSTPMVRIETRSRLRLVVPVPEAYVAGVAEGVVVACSVPAWPNQTFEGKVARISHRVDVATRTMPVELDVANSDGRLDPGMFPEVRWPVRRPSPTLFVPASAVTRTTERSFVIRVRDGTTEWVDVKTGGTSADLVEVFGALREGDEVALRGTDELRPGMRVDTAGAAAK